jgi:phosphotriesterase-related protein
MVQTVTGPVRPEDLGRTLIHQHLVFGYPGWENAVLSPFDKEKFLDKAEKILGDMRDRCGVRTIVDATTGDCGRNPELMKEVAERTGLNIIATSGYYYEGEGAPAYFKFRMAYGNAEEEIYQMMRTEVREGIHGTGIRAGVLKIATSSGQITEYEDLFIRAAARVSSEEKVPIITHTQGGTMAAEQARRLLEYGADPEHIMIGHLDNCADMDELMKVFEAGVFGGFDRFGIQGFTGALPETRRIAAVVGIANSGYEDRIMIAHDSILQMLGDPWIYTEKDAKDLENWTWTHVFDDIIPRFHEMGLSDETTEKFVSDNVKRLFSYQ